MYQSSFGFQLRPFSATPRHDWFFESASAHQVYQSITRCIERAAGPAMLIGAAGTGKSLMCQLIANDLRAVFSVVVLDSARLCTRRAFLQNILFEIGLPYRGMEEGELRLSLMDYLQPSAKCPHGMLLLVDEAHVLPMRLLEELRMITNLVRNGRPRVRLVLAGNRTLEERFAHPKLESFNQRIAARCYLKPLNRTETADYVGFQLEKAGGAQCRGVIAGDAIQTIYEVTEGLPRLINQVCDHALLLAAADGKKIVAAGTIAEAWGDIQQLPTPWYATGTSIKQGPAVIEFGELDAAEPEPAVEDEEVRNEGAIEFVGKGLVPTLAATHREHAADRSELKSDDPLETLDNISRAIGNASSAVAEASGNTASSPARSARAAGANQSQTKPKAEFLAEQDPEFAFDGLSDPFAEEFDSEETVADPFPAEQLAAARLAAAAAMQSDVELVEDRKESAADREQDPVRDEVPVSHHPEVTVTFDKKTGHSIFTIGNGKQAPSATVTVASPGSAAGEVAKQPERCESATANRNADSQDDRDMIIGIDDLDSPIRVAADTHPDQAKKARAHRAEYQTLFSRMRNG